MIRARVRRTIEERRLLQVGDRVVVAVSGGPDSTALLHVLAGLRDALSITLVAVGVDHGLRAGASAELDVAASSARTLEVPFQRVTITEAKHGASTQRWAREVRYAALREVADGVGARVVATGHSADDQAETVLARLLRGGGVRGLAGIDPRRADGVIRPLIDCRREAIRHHVREVGLDSARDPSNDERRYERTRVRAEIVPALIAEQALAVERLCAIADEARETERALDAVAAGLLARASGPEGLDASVLREAPPPLALRALRRWAETHIARAIGRAHLVALVARLHADGEVLLPGGWVARRQGSRLRLDAPRNDLRKDERHRQSSADVASDEEE